MITPKIFYRHNYPTTTQVMQAAHNFFRSGTRRPVLIVGLYQIAPSDGLVWLKRRRNMYTAILENYPYIEVKQRLPSATTILAAHCNKCDAHWSGLGAFDVNAQKFIDSHKYCGDSEICCDCGVDVSKPEGKWVNRVPVLDFFDVRRDMGRKFPHGGFVCRDCDQKESDNNS